MWWIFSVLLQADEDPDEGEHEDHSHQPLHQDEGDTVSGGECPLQTGMQLYNEDTSAV